MNTSLTIAGALEAILSYATSEADDLPIGDDSEPSTCPCQKEYDYVCSKLDVTPVQAELFAAILELSLSGDASAENIARKLGVTNLHFVSLRPELDVLASKRYIRCTTKGYKGLCCHVPEEAIKSIQNNEKPNAEDISGLSTTGILRKSNNLFREFWRDSISVDTLQTELFDIFRYNPENNFVKEYVRLGINEMPSCEQLLFMYMTTRRTAFQEAEFGWEDFGKIFTDSFIEDYMHRGLENEGLNLMTAGIIENVNNEGIVDSTQVCFVEDVINKMLGDICSTPNSRSNCRSLISCSTISGKDLFFNDEVDKQVKTLANLLKQENFSNVVTRLKEKGFRSGFASLFYGTPGTGKTEAALQLARMTSRDVFMVDMSQLKSKWVGDSEKNIRALFQEYRRIVKDSDIAPIMLFNEADAIFGVRKKGAEDSVDKMNNSIQNIILGEMETLEGILIATTNLEENLDSAFQRRFLYKIHFEKPDKEARTHIWESMMEGIEAEDAEALANDFEFSGGQIENISRKATVDYVITGVKTDLAGLRELCHNEKLGKKKKDRVRIGF